MYVIDVCDRPEAVARDRQQMKDTASDSNKDQLGMSLRIISRHGLAVVTI